MNTSVQRRMTRTAASAAGLLLLSLWSGVGRGGADDNGTASPLNSLQDAGVPDAGNALPTPPPPQRLNSSLSMPYFSFAQSLNSRS